MATAMSDKIAEKLFGKTRRRVLGLLFGRTHESFYLRQIVRLTEAGVGAVQRELKGLTEAGLVIRTRQGKQVYFQANPDSPIFDDLRRLVEKTMGLADQVRVALIPFEEDGRIEFAFLFGSVASGVHSTASDVDLMILGDTRLAEMAPTLRPVQDKLARDINPVIYGVDEFMKKAAMGDHFAASVMERPRIMLVGDEHDLERLAGQSLADQP